MRVSTRRRCWRALWAALLLAMSAGVGAASLQVSPTTVEVSAARNAAGLTLTNHGDQPLTVQVRVFRWTQADGEDVLAPGSDLAISPPMLTLPAGGEQLVRIVRLGPPPTQETAYRVVVDELPLDRDDGAGSPGLRFVLRYSIPVFLAPAGDSATAPTLHAQVAAPADGRAFHLENIGNGRAQVSDLAYVADDGGRQVIAAGLSGYVLPGQRRSWMLPPALATASGGSINARINGETQERTLAVLP